MYVCMYVRIYIYMYECMYKLYYVCIVLFVRTNMCVCVCVCVCGRGVDPGFLGPKAYTILEAILRKRIQN